MKRTCMMLVALALILGLAQCKKNTEQSIGEKEDEKVFITLNVNQGNGSKLDVDPPHVVFQNGDKIYVASNGVYVGYLEYNGTNFDGEISNAIEGQPLYFYLLGNVTPAETLTSGSTTSCSVVISDQTVNKPVIACNKSNENFGTTNTFTSTLRNKCALVKFNVTTVSEAATCITGMKNQVTVDFSANTLTHSQEGIGIITLPAGSGEKWAILLPQDAMEAGEAGSAYSVDGEYTGTCGAVPAIYDNGFLTAGIAVNVTTEVNPSEVPVGAISGKFTINANGDQVYFSKGNLQYIGSATTPYWKFAENQWDYLGTTTGQNSNNQNVDRDLFGWGTSGYNHGAICYRPWSSTSNNSDYYAYGNWQYNLYDHTGKADWGYNPINNGGNQENQWRTLTKPEWHYVFYNRVTTSGIYFAKANVNNVNGIILLPDDWSNSIYSLISTNNGTVSYSSNIISSSQWTTLENAGAVFLPVAGWRSETSAYYGTSVYDIDSHGHYWSASFGDRVSSYCVYFSDLSLDTDNGKGRYGGRSVRLVQNYNY